MQIAATPRFRPRVSSAFRSVTRIRAPEAPIGWPSAQAPPLTLTRSCGAPVIAMKAIGTTAKASFTSHRSTSPTDQPSRSSSFRAAGTGAVGKSAGACAWLAWPRIRARTGRPWVAAASAEASTSAAAPSEIDEELAGVTVPSLRKAGFSVGIFSGLAVAGCSSAATTVSPLRVLTVTGAISASKAPEAWASSARDSEASA